MNNKIILLELINIRPNKGKIYSALISVIICPAIGVILSEYHQSEIGIIIGGMLGGAALGRLLTLLDFRKQVDNIIGDGLRDVP